MAFQVTSDLLHELRESEGNAIELCALLELTEADLDALASSTPLCPEEERCCSFGGL